jgi:hypothetical protein
MTLKAGRIFEANLTKVTVIGSVVYLAYNHGYIIPKLVSEIVLIF